LPAETGTVRLPKEIVRKLGIVAQHTDKSIGEIIAGWISTRVDTEFRRTVQAMSAEIGGES